MPPPFLQYDLTTNKECVSANLSNKYNTDEVFGNLNYVNLKLLIQKIFYKVATSKKLARTANSKIG